MQSTSVAMDRYVYSSKFMLEMDNEKTTPWRGDSISITPPASDAVSFLGSHYSIAGDDVAAISPTQFVKVAFTTTIFNNNNSHHSGHKKLNRSQSEPRAHNSGNSASLRYKTELCHALEENGVCKYGEKCQFAHGVHELRDLARHPKYKTELCRPFHAEGYCPYGTRCHFIHEGAFKSKPSALCLYPNDIPSVSSLKDLSLSPDSMSSLSPATSMTAFAFSAAAPIMQFSPVCSPPPSPTNTSRLPIFNEISASTLRSLVDNSAALPPDGTIVSDFFSFQKDFI